MRIFVVLLSLCLLTMPGKAQTNWGRAISSAIKAGQTMTITDEDLAKMVRQQVIAMDKQDNVCGENSKYN